MGGVRGCGWVSEDGWGVGDIGERGESMREGGELIKVNL